MARAALIAGLLVLANCGEAKEPNDIAPRETALQPRIPPTNQAPAGAESMWTSGAIGGEAAAVFTSASREPLFSVLCGEGRAIVLQRHLQPESPPLTTMELKSGSVTRRLEAGRPESDSTVLRAALPYNDSFIASLTDLSEPVLVSAGGAPTLVLPPHRMIGEFIRDCAR